MSKYWMLLLAIALVGGCSTSTSKNTGDPPMGTERGVCYPNDTCNAGLVCLSGICVDPGTQDAGVDGTVESDGSPEDGAITNDGDLPDGGSQDAEALKENGADCTAPTECESEYCVEGVCCNGECGGNCQSCKVANNVGTCTNVLDNTDPKNVCGHCRSCINGSCTNATRDTDPKNNCDWEDPSTCRQTGECDGGGQCANYPSGTECRNTCSTGRKTRVECDGSGNGGCTQNETTTTCGAYACDGTECRNACDYPEHSHCAPFYKCSQINTCVLDIENPDYFEWISLTGGTYLMGWEEVEIYEWECSLPLHSVEVPSFEILKTEVTVEMYDKCVIAGNCGQPTNSVYPACNWGEIGYEKHPVNCITWSKARDFCAWIGGRLPSESEWEYAARSEGQNREYPWGDETATCDRAVMLSGSSGCGTQRTWEICNKQAGNTDQSLCDMAGNVNEWVEDDWHDDYTGAPADGSAWVDPVRSDWGVLRGGSFGADMDHVRSRRRYKFYKGGTTATNAGFRCVR